MKRQKRNNIALLLFLAFALVMLTQCKSGDITVLGLFSKKIGGTGDNKMAFESDKTFTISGTITDVLKKPVAHADVYVTMGNFMVCHVQSDSLGNYSVRDLSPDIYTFNIAGPGMPIYNKEQLEIRKGIDLNHVDFTLDIKHTGQGNKELN